MRPTRAGRSLPTAARIVVGQAGEDCRSLGLLCLCQMLAADTEVRFGQFEYYCTGRP